MVRSLSWDRQVFWRAIGLPVEMERGKAPMGELLREGIWQASTDKMKEEPVGWSPPRPGWVKVNTDAGFCGD
jgi:hypothetical protein